MDKSNSAIAANMDLFDNPFHRLPVCLCLDISSSMSFNDKIDQLNEGMALFYKSIGEDEDTTNVVEIAVVTFGEFPPVAKCVRDFSGVDIQQTPPVLNASGYTPLGEGVNLALDLIEKRKDCFRKVGISCFRPWLIIMSDGNPEGNSPAELVRAQQRVAKATANKKIITLTISIGNDDNPELSKMGGNTLLHLKEDGISNFFIQLYKSISDYLTPGE